MIWNNAFIDAGMSSSWRIDSSVKLSVTVSSLRQSQASRDPLVASTRHTCGALFILPYCSLAINQESRPHDMLNKKRTAEWLSCIF